MKFSLCMIVKNEAAVLRDCLNSLRDIMDEIIIVDTGSTDETKSIAYEYTTQVYDFEWKDDFAEARNFAFSKASGDYIYSADADEVIDEENRTKFKALKKVLLPEVEIVQMIYVTEQINHPTENYARDMRPKLFKRVRSFTWIEPIHETINTAPVVYDSDIEIRHRPQGNHSIRDFAVFEKVIEQKGVLSDRLLGMYLRELYKAGTEDVLVKAKSFLELQLDIYRNKQDAVRSRQIIAVLIKIYRIIDSPVQMLKIALYDEATIPSAEICMELGYYFMKKEEYEEATNWFARAAHECESDIDVASSGTSAYMALALSLRKLSKTPKLKALPQNEYDMECARLHEKAAEYEQMARNWKPQEPIVAG